MNAKVRGKVTVLTSSTGGGTAMTELVLSYDSNSEGVDDKLSTGRGQERENTHRTIKLCWNYVHTLQWQSY